MKNQSRTIKTNPELYRVVMVSSGGHRKLPGGSGDFSWHTDRPTLHHNIYIITININNIININIINIININILQLIIIASYFWWPLGMFPTINCKTIINFCIINTISASPIALPELISNYNQFLHKDHLLQHKKGSGSDFQSQSNELPLDDPNLHKMLTVEC